MTLALVLAAGLALAVVLFVARPFLRDPTPVSDVLDEPSELERRRLELVEERDRALAALKELEFDHRTGKVTDEDYRQQVGPLRRSAAATLRALELRTEAKHERIASGR
jgi:hypothetical protein